MSNLCRDESTGILKSKIEAIFGANFNINGLGAVLTCGATGVLPFALLYSRTAADVLVMFAHDAVAFCVSLPGGVLTGHASIVKQCMMMTWEGGAGMGAGLSHAPIDSSSSRERYVFFSFPHIAIDDEGNLGKIHRPGRAGESAACGALLTALNLFQACPPLPELPCYATSVCVTQGNSQHNLPDSLEAHHSNSNFRSLHALVFAMYSCP